MKPTGASVAARAVRAVAEGHPYAEMDCQAFVEFCVHACGGNMAYAGSNDMARNAVTGLWTLAEAKRLGKLVPGAGLFIHEESGMEPAKYRTDGMGNFSHVGLYVGSNALSDTDKNGKTRACDCAHASATLQRVAGSTLANAWTHVGWFREIDYGMAIAQDDAAQTDLSSANGAKTNAATAVAASTAGYYTVKRGCKGGAVRRLQTWLCDLGYALGVCGADGDFGVATDAAVRAFQETQGLTVDGVVGPKTWAALATVRNAAMVATAGKDAADLTPEGETAMG